LPKSIEIGHDGFCNSTRKGVHTEIFRGISSSSRPLAIAIDESQYLAWLKSTTLKCWVSKRMLLVMISRRLTLSELNEADFILSFDHLCRNRLSMNCFERQKNALTCYIVSVLITVLQSCIIRMPQKVHIQWINSDLYAPLMKY
jgi:hypothetical protein